MVLFWSLATVIVVATTCTGQDLPWWRNAVFYQVYPRSFKDSNGDGVGDLKGIADKAEYLKEIGVTAIWISPIYQSPMKDFGYDISDYRAIDPIFGSLDDFKQLSQKLRQLGIKLLLDLVLNHSSDEHPWFQLSLQRESPYTDYYVWNDGVLNNTTNEMVPPNNWPGRFSGSAWEWSDERNQFYYHQFLKQQVDLNYRNPAVIQEIMDVMKFWLDMGVDGFRMDAVPYLVEDDQLRDEEILPGTDGEWYDDFDHSFTENRPETYEVMTQLAQFIYNYSLNDGRPRALFCEAYANLTDTLKYYGTGKLSFMIPFDFDLLMNGNQSTRPQQLHDIITSWVDNMPAGSVPNWVIGNHDRSRISERYGPEMVDAMNMLTSVLPGVKVVYNGEEIGMEDTFYRWDQTIDPQGLAKGPYHYTEASRDPCRSPFQWDSSVSAGFSTNKSTWLSVNPNYWWLNVEAQKAAENSHLKVFKAVVQARQDPELLFGTLQVLVPNNDTLVIVRTYNDSSYVLIINMGSEIASYTTQSLFSPHGLDQDMVIRVPSINSGLTAGMTVEKGSANLTLRPRSAVLLRTLSSPTPRLSTMMPTTSLPPENSSFASHIASSIYVVLVALCLGLTAF